VVNGDSLMLCGRGWCCQQWQETELIAKKASRAARIQARRQAYAL